MARTDTLSIRLTSRRAPYTRAGIKFASIREPLTFAQDELTTDQLLRLQADPAIQIELVDPKSGDPTSATLADILPPPADGTDGETSHGDAPPAPADGGAADTSDQSPPPAGDSDAGQVGAGSVPPAPAAPARAPKKGAAKS